MRISARLMGIVLSSTLAAGIASAAEGQPAFTDITPTTAPAADSKLTQTVGIDIVEAQRNADKSMKLTFQ